MLETMYNIFSNQLVFGVAAWVGLIVSVILMIMILPRKNRDERGWKILGKASTITLAYFFIIVNVVAKVTMRMEVLNYIFDFEVCGNIIQLIYDTVLLVEIIAILILKRVE